MVRPVILFFGLMFFVAAAADGTVRGLFNWVDRNDRGKMKRINHATEEGDD